MTFKALEETKHAPTLYLIVHCRNKECSYWSIDNFEYFDDYFGHGDHIFAMVIGQGPTFIGD